MKKFKTRKSSVRSATRPKKAKLTTREITVRMFVTDLLRRIDRAKTIDCCKKELKTFARLALKKIPRETIRVPWSG